MVHDLKCWPVPFADVWHGQKRAEYRKDDRMPRFCIGDRLRLHEFTPCASCGAHGRRAPGVGETLFGVVCCSTPHGTYSGRYLLAEVTHVLRGTGRFGLPEGYAVLSLTVYYRGERGDLVGLEAPHGISV